MSYIAQQKTTAFKTTNDKTCRCQYLMIINHWQQSNENKAVDNILQTIFKISTQLSSGERYVKRNKKNTVICHSDFGVVDGLLNLQETLELSSLNLSLIILILIFFLYLFILWSFLACCCRLVLYSQVFNVPLISQICLACNC